MTPHPWEPAFPLTDADRERLHDQRDLSLWHPRARDTATFRRALVPMWLPGAAFSQISKIVASYGKHNFVPEWERLNLLDAELWFVGAEMCDLLMAAAPSMPATELHPHDVPDRSGLVVFARPLMGLDADGSPYNVAVGAYLWGPGEHRVFGEAIGISAYGPHVFPDRGLTEPYLQPLGGCIWPFGASAEVELVGDAATDASMVEDRRFLQALWYLAEQPGVASNHRSLPTVHNKAKKRRGDKPPDPVRVVHLARRPATATGTRSEDEATKRDYTVRWMVRGHWRNQAYGPKHGLRRPLFIHPYLKGPEGKPMVEHVKVVDR